jgi:hypothetical protein
VLRFLWGHGRKDDQPFRTTDIKQNCGDSATEVRKMAKRQKGFPRIARAGGAERPKGSSWLH